MRYKIADGRLIIGTAASHWLTLVVQNGQNAFAVYRVQLDAVAELAREQGEAFCGCLGASEGRRQECVRQGRAFRGFRRGNFLIERCPFDGPGLLALTHQDFYVWRFLVFSRTR